MILPLADPTPSPSPDLSTATESIFGWVPGLLSLATFLVLALATFVIWRYMNRSITSIDFDEETPPGTGGSAPTP